MYQSYLQGSSIARILGYLESGSSIFSLNNLYQPVLCSILKE
jgi:hypothetical protein